MCNTIRIMWFNTNKTAQGRPGQNQYTFTAFKSIRKNALSTFYSQFVLPRSSGKAVSILLLKELRKMHQLWYSFECVSPFTSCIFTSQCSDGWMRVSIILRTCGIHFQHRAHLTKINSETCVLLMSFKSCSIFFYTSLFISISWNRILTRKRLIGWASKRTMNKLNFVHRFWVQNLGWFW